VREAGQFNLLACTDAAGESVFTEQVHFFDLNRRVEDLEVMLNEGCQLSESELVAHAMLDDHMSSHDRLVRC
jgi:hypothetical protein